MPEATFNGTTKTIHIEKCGTYEKTLKTCRDKFRNKHISIIVKDGQVLEADNLKDMTSNSTLRCYTITEFKRLSKQQKEEHEKDKNEANNPKPALITNMIKESYYPYKINKKITYISTLFGIKEIILYPNLSDNDIFPKGSVIISNSLFPSIGMRLGRGTTFYFVKNIEPKLKKLKSLKCDLFDGYAEIHKIVEYYDKQYEDYNYLVVVRMSKSNDSKMIIDNCIKRDSSCMKYGCTDKENKQLISEFIQLKDKTTKLREISCKKILNKLNIDLADVIKFDQIENSIYYENKRYYSLTNVIDCRTTSVNLVTGSRNTSSYVVKPLTNYLPSGSGRKIDYFDTIEIAKLNKGEINGEIRNNSLICDSQDNRTIYQKYHKGYKNPDITIKDIENMKLGLKLLKTEVILTYKL
uniref:Uncharacterized protein n=1 Tax=viral metagenome TaxID=1070528 RepID=A0A6C0ABV4_9ZZZZ